MKGKLFTSKSTHLKISLYDDRKKTLADDFAAQVNGKWFFVL